MNFMTKEEMFLLEEMVNRNFAAKYKDSVLGILWSVLKPLLIMVLLTIIFSTLFGRNIENYPVYLLSGKCIYDFFVSGTNVALYSIKGNKNILKRTPAPKHIFVLGGIISEFINFLISLIILFGVMIVTGVSFNFITISMAIIPIISVSMMITGVGLILSILCVFFTDIKHLWSIVTLMLMYASALFYPIEIVPEPFRQYMILNPLFWVIDQVRHFILWNTFPSTLNIVNSVLLSGIILVVGIIIFKKFERNIAMKF